MMATRSRFRRRRDEAGYAAALVALLASTVFIGMAALGVDTARLYVEAEQVQKAADAAALAGVTYMPNDMTNARATALAVAKKNGFDDASATVTVTVEVGSKPSELRVTVASKVDNVFGRAINSSSAWVTRTAVADYTAPAPMGSPCNTFGNEPRGASGSTAPGPTGSALPNSSFPNCPKDGVTGTSQPLFWGSIEGPATDKFQGDRYSTNVCTEVSPFHSSPVYGCSGGTNTEYRADGTYFAVHVEPGAVGTPIDVQIYDPAFVNTGAFCQGDRADNAYTASGYVMVPKASAVADNMNPFTPTGGKTRYGAWKIAGTSPPADYTGTDANTGAREYCTGDSYPSYNKTPCWYPSGARSNPCYSTPVNTTFVLRDQNPTDDPTVATPISGCTRQFRGWDRPPQVAQLTSTNASYNQQLAQVYHQWYNLCTFTPDEPGNYFLQVRTNVLLAGTSTANTNGHQPMIYNGTSAATAAVGNTLLGAGSNSFGLRAVMSDDTKRSLVAVSGWQRMPIMQNAPGTAVFNLARALPNTKGQYLSFSFFDAADGPPTGGTVKVLPPLDATGSVMDAGGVPGCKSGFNDASPGTYTTLSACTQPVNRTSTDGQVVHMVIPIPNDYSCDNSTLGGCWFRVEMAYSGAVTDFTTWSASIGGDPVRLIE